MACSKCKKRKFHTGRVIEIDPFSSIEGESIEALDENLYQVQSRMHTVVSVSDGQDLRFLPGERLNLVGTLLYALLNSDPKLFIFTIGAERRSFLSLHPVFEGII